MLKKNTFSLFMHPIFLLCAVLLFTSCDSQKTIVNSLTEKEANEIVVFLSTKGITANKVQVADVGGGGGVKEILFDITVSPHASTEAMAILNQSGLPRRRGQSLLGIFKDVGLVPSEMQEKIRYQAGLAEQIASTIRKIDGILDAEVQISFPEEDPLKPQDAKGIIVASVYIKHSGVLDDPNTHLITKIKRLVAASITGLQYDNVTIISDRARFSEIPIGSLRGLRDKKELVSVWTIIIAKEAVWKFRILFFGLVSLLLLLIVSMIWIGWKLYPLLQEHGGVRALLHIQPILAEKPVEKPESEEEEEEESLHEDIEDEQPPGVT